MAFLPFGMIILGLIGAYWIISKRFFASAHATRRPASGRTAAPPPARSQRPAWHVTLGVSEFADVDEIRTAYKRLMSRYHPDKAGSLGEEQRLIAARTASEVTAAYREGMNARGLID